MTELEKLNEGIDTFTQSNTNAVFQYFLIEELKSDITLTADVSVGDSVINVSAGHGFIAAAGEVMTLWEGGYFEQVSVKSVATNAITLDIPVGLPFTQAGLITIVRGSKKLNVDGSTPRTFTFKPRGLVPVDIGGVRINMEHTGSGDLSTFGDIAGGITNGMYVYKDEGTIRSNLGNYKKNADFFPIGGNPTFPAKAAGGNPGTLVEIPINNPENFDAVIRAELNQEFIVSIRDAAVSTLLDFNFSLLGSFTSGE
jgi:hypothetical protein